MDELTESARQCLVSQGMMIGILSVLNSIVLFLTGLVVLIRASDILRFTSLLHLAVLEVVCGFFSTLVVSYICLILAGYKNRHLEVRLKYLDEKISKGLFITFFVIIVSFSALVVSAIFLMLKADTSSTYEIKSTMSLYAVDCTRKVIIDSLQILFKCCGSVSLLDWFTIDWQNDGFGQNVTYTDWDSVPFSCCNPEIAPPCIHHQLRAYGVASLFPDGCAEKLDEVTFYFVLGAVIMFFISTFVMIFLLYITRKVQTSARSAIIKGDSTAPGSWWLLCKSECAPPPRVNECCMPLLEKPRVRHNKTEQVFKMEKQTRSPFVRRTKKRPSTELEDWESYRTEKSDTKTCYEDSSEDWTRMANNASASSSTSSFLTSTVPLNSTSETRHSVSDTAVANLEVSHHFEHKVRPLFRS